MKCATIYLIAISLFFSFNVFSLSHDDGICSLFRSENPPLFAAGAEEAMGISIWTALDFMRVVQSDELQLQEFARDLVPALLDFYSQSSFVASEEYAFDEHRKEMLRHQAHGILKAVDDIFGSVVGDDAACLRTVAKMLDQRLSC